MPIYTYATKNQNNNSYKIIYDRYGIFTFRSENDAERHFTGSISGTRDENLEFITLNITDLVEKGFIPKEQLHEIWK